MTIEEKLDQIELAFQEKRVIGINNTRVYPYFYFKLDGEWKLGRQLEMRGSGMGIDDIKDAEYIRVLDANFAPDRMTHAMIRDTSMGLLTGLITEVHSIL